VLQPQSFAAVATSVVQPALKLGEYLVKIFAYAPLTKSSNMGDIVVIVVAEENAQKTFVIARTLLDQKAPGFMKTTNPLGSDDCPVFHLTNVEIATFELFIKWLDTDPENNRRNHTGAPLHLAFEERAWERMIPAIKTYIFGERYSIPALCNDALFHLSAFVQAHLRATWSLTNLDRWVYDRELAHRETTYVYANTCDDSKLRQFSVDAYRVMYVPKTASSFAVEKYPQQFITEVLTYKGKRCDDLYPYSKWDGAHRMKQWQRDGMQIASEQEEDELFYGTETGIGEYLRASLARMRSQSEMENEEGSEAEHGELSPISESTDTRRAESPGYLMGAWRWITQQYSRAGMGLGMLSARE
jgi:hypothetical protein